MRTFAPERGTSGTHRMARTVGTRFGTRYVALCGTSAYVVGSDSSAPVTCARCLAKTRYRAREATLGRFTVWAIYDQEKHAWPAYTRGLSVPQRFPSAEDAQAWADEHLNGGTR